MGLVQELQENAIVILQSNNETCVKLGFVNVDGDEHNTEIVSYPDYDKNGFPTTIYKQLVANPCRYFIKAKLLNIEQENMLKDVLPNSKVRIRICKKDFDSVFVKCDIEGDLAIIEVLKYMGKGKSWE